MMKIRASKEIIKKKDVGMEFRVYNGKSFLKVYIEVSMVGSKYGEFILTRRKLSLRKQEEKKKVKVKNKKK